MSLKIDQRFSKLRFLIVVLLAAGSLTGCIWKEYTTPQEIKEFWEPQPATYDEAMLKGNRMMAENRVDKGIEYFRLAGQLVQDQYGPDDPRIANASELAATILADRGKLGDAEELYRKAYEVRLRTSRPNSPELVELSKKYADVLVKNFKLDEAKKVYPQIGTTAKSGGKTSGKRKHH